MELKDVVKIGKEKNPIRLCVYGSHGVGKTTFCAAAPKAIMLLTEQGADNIDCAKLPLCRSFDDVVKYMGMLCNEQHEYQHLIIDSLDWLELLIHKDICQKRGKSAIADFDFGRGYSYALDHFMRILTGCDMLRDTKGMGIVFTAHAKAEEFKCPVNGIYNRYSLDVHKSIAAKIAHWSDVIGFAHFGTRVVSDEGKFNSEHRRVVGGKRIIGFEDTPAYEAKRRITLPDKLELDAVKFWELLK